MPVINPFGVIAGFISAGTTNASLGEVVFSNSNNVSFGISGQTVTASIAGGGGGNTGSISAGTTRLTLGEAVFSDSNGLSFGVNGQTITGSYTVPNTAGLISFINVSGGTTSNNLTNVVFSNSNNISFGLNGSTLTASINTSLTNINISAGTTSNNLSAVVFSNSNGITFGLNGSTITASHNGITSQTNQTLGLYAVGNTTGQSSSSTFDARTISFVGQGNVSVGYSNGSVNISGTQTVQTQGFSNTLGMSNLGNTSGTSGVISGTGLQYLFAGGPNITLSQSINGQSATLTISGGAGGAGNTGSISAGTTRATLGEVVFSDSNGVSFGVNGQTVTASIATSLTNIRVSAGTTSNLLSALTFNNANGISFGLDASTITASYTVPTVTNSSWTVSDNATSGTVARLAFTNLNNVTLSLSTGAGGSHTIVGSINTSLSNIRVSAGTTSNLLSAITFSNSNNVSFGINASTITASINTSLTAINVSAGTTSNNLSAFTLSNSNGISFGLNASTITASYTVPGTLSVFAQSNTTQSSSGTIPFNSLQFNGAGIASVGVSNGSVIISVPAGGGGGDGGVFAGVSTAGNTAGSTGTVSTGNFVLVGSRGITLSQSTGAAGSAATVTILGDGVSLNYFEVFPKVSISNVSNMTLTLLTQRPILIPFQLFGSLTHNHLDIEVSRATSGSNAFTMQAAIYTYVNSTQISRLATLQNVFSNTDTGSISGIRRIRLTGFEAAGSTLSPGEYVMMLYASAGATASMNYSYRGGITASPDVGVIGGGTNVVTTATSAMSNGGFRKWHGLWSTTTASPPASLALSDISQHTRGVPIYFYMGRT
jgi:hypothetical protein